MQQNIDNSASSPPVRFAGPSAWTAADLQRDPSLWHYELSAEDIEDLESATHSFLTHGKEISSISQDTFPLNSFDKHLIKLREKLLKGSGVELIQGLPLERYSEEFAATLFCGIGSHIGKACSQNAQGHILGHVRDIGLDANDPNSRIYQTNERQTFHTDSADVVGLLCLQNAKEGGESLLVSAESIYNRMKSERPDLLDILFNPIATDRRGETPSGEKPFMTIPVFNWFAGFLTVFYQRQYIMSAQRFEHADRLSPTQMEALDMFDRLANDRDLHFTMRLKPGDMQFVYNHSQLHDRTGFVDWPEPHKRRHLLRLWLSPEGDRPLPQCFKQRYGSIEIGNRGGIRVT